MWVLYAESDAGQSELARLALERSAPHLSLDLAGTLDQALQCLRSRTSTRPYEVVFANLRLPGGSGLDLLAEVRRSRAATAGPFGPLPRLPSETRKPPP